MHNNQNLSEIKIEDQKIIKNILHQLAFNFEKIETSDLNDAKIHHQ